MDQCDDQQEPKVILRGVSRNDRLAEMPISDANGKKAEVAYNGALKSKDRQKEIVATIPMEASATPISNWNGLTPQPMLEAAICGNTM